MHRPNLFLSKLAGSIDVALSKHCGLADDISENVVDVAFESR